MKFFLFMLAAIFFGSLGIAVLRHEGLSLFSTFIGAFLLQMSGVFAWNAGNRG